MDLMERPSMRRLIRDLKRHAPLLSLGVVAIVVLVSTAVVIGASRQAMDRDAGLTALASPSPRPSATPSMTPASTRSPTPVPATPTPVATPEAPPPTPVPSTDGDSVPDWEADTDPIDVEDPSYYEGPTVEPEVSLQLGGQPGDVGFWIRTGDTADEVLNFHAHDLDRSECSLTQSYEPDDPRDTPWTVALEPLPEQTVSMVDGLHVFVATCRTEVGEVGAGVRGIAMDGKPEACRDFEFERGEISVASREELTADIVGTWKGCVTTPWTPMYEVTVTLRADGTYSATSTEILDSTDMEAMYWGTDDDYPGKLYAIDGLQDSRLGSGQIVVGYGPDVDVRDGLRNVRLMGDQLEFELLHMEQYGPITFQLYRQ